jgi:YVTN family beta-propeller protein
MIRRLFAVAIACAVVASPAAASRLLVVSKEKKALEVYDGTEYKLLFALDLPGQPHEVATSHDGRYAYVADYEGFQNTVSVIDLKSRERIADVNVAPSYKPHGLAVSKDDAHLYVTCEASRAVVEMDLTTRKVKRTFKLRDDSVHLLALSTEGKRVFATSQANGTVSYIDLATGELERTVFSGRGCEGIAATPDGRELWAVNRTVQTLSVINLETNKRELTVSCVGNPLRLHFTPDASEVLVSCAMQNGIAVFDRAQRKEITRIAVGQFPIVIEVTPDGKRYFVTNGHAASVSVIDAASRKEVTTIPVGGDPEGLVYVE